MAKPTAADRFWAKVNKDGPVPTHRQELGPCWVWTGATIADGYGVFALKKGRLVKAHRFVWTLEGDPIPDALCSLHKCDNPPCVRPSHLFQGTRADNVADAVAKGRMVYHAPRNGHDLNRRKTHCPEGHPYDSQNTVVYDGRRNCRICLNSKSLRRYHAKRRIS